MKILSNANYWKLSIFSRSFCWSKSFFKRVPVRWTSSLFSLHCPNKSYTHCLMTNCEKLCPGQNSIVKDMSKEEILYLERSVNTTWWYWHKGYCWNHLLSSNWPEVSPALIPTLCQQRMGQNKNYKQRWECSLKIICCQGLGLQLTELLPNFRT